MILNRIHLWILYHERNYDQVLKKTVFKISKDINKIDDFLLRYQARCSFYKENFYHSKMCFEILEEKETATSKDYNYLAYIHARHNERDKAISRWCKALEINKNDNISKKNLEYIRKQSTDINFSEDEFFEKALPKEPFLIPLKLLFKILIIGVIGFGLIIGGYYLYTNVIKKIIISKPITRTELNKVKLPDFNPNLLEKPKEEGSNYSYSEDEIKNMFGSIKKLISDKSSVDAQIEINKIRLSNGSPQVKAKMDILETFIEEPDYGSFVNTVDINKFLKEKPLYKNVYIMWKGRVANLSLYKDKITFDIFVGDEETGTVDGILPVVFNKAIISKNKDIVKVFGIIKTDEPGNYFIEGHVLIKNVK